VLGIRTDVTFANLSMKNTARHLRQLERRDTQKIAPTEAPPLWQRNGDTNSVPLTGSTTANGWVRPTTPALNRSIGFLDSLSDEMSAPKDSTQIGTIWVKFAKPTLLKADVATLLLIQDNIGKRPIYFSWSDGAYPDGGQYGTLDLSPYLVTQGMVRKLMDHPVTPGGAIVNSPMGFVDVPKTRTLLFSIYHPEAAAQDRPLGWFDPPSASILSLYQIVYNGFGQVLMQQGDTTDALKASSIVTRIGKSIGNQ
jgi:hypothetical protein